MKLRENSKLEKQTGRPPVNVFDNMSEKDYETDTYHVEREKGNARSKASKTERMEGSKCNARKIIDMTYPLSMCVCMWSEQQCLDVHTFSENSSFSGTVE